MPKTFKFKDGGSLTLFTQELIFKIDTNERNAMDAVTKFVQGEIIQRHTDSPRGGRIYRRGQIGTAAGRATVQRASAPGEAPAVDSNLLRSSISAGIKKVSPGYIGIVGTDVKYAIFLEEGTGRMDPRPLWAVTLRDLQDEIYRTFERFLSQ